MLTIWGIRVTYRTIGRGLFHCPRCGGDRRYRRRDGRRFLTLFLIPVIPLTGAGEHVLCATCRARHDVGVLRAPTAAQMQAALPAGMRAAASTMLRAGDQDSLPARNRAIQAIIGAGAQGYGDAALDADLAEPDSAWAPALTQVGAQLAVPAREWFLAAVVRIGMADGPLTAAQREAAHAIGARLGMTHAQTVGVITLTEQGASAE